MSHLEDDFWRFHWANPVVYQVFSRFALEAALRGRRKFGVAAIWERMRWELNLATDGDEYKLNNNYPAFYARLWMADNPQHQGLFSLREQRVPMKTTVDILS